MSFIKRLSLQKLRKNSSSPTKNVQQPQAQHVEQQEQLPEDDIVIGSGINGTSTTDMEPLPTPEEQTVLLLHAAKQPYQLTEDYPVPQLEGEHDVLVRTQAIGLNPIDWKAPDFNFAIPELPYISGRELAGEVVQTSRKESRFKPRDRVLAISTDYRDLRKAAYQQYVISFDYNTVRIPPSLSPEEGSTLGVAFVAAALSLGVCMGVDFSSILSGPDLFSLLRSSVPQESLAEDIRSECLDGIRSHERAKAGDWVAVWGGSSTSANLTIQLAKLAGLKVVTTVDKAKHGLRLSNHEVLKADLLVDSHDPERAVQIIRQNLKGKLRFGVDTRGRESATSLLHALSPDNIDSPPLPAGEAPPSPPGTPKEETLLGAHLIGLTGLPKQQAPEGTMFHTVPIKLFHEVPEVGGALCQWLERLLAEGLVKAPEIIDVEQGLESINKGLDRMRRGEISGGKLVVRVAE
ncbi:chaperonin 10-like protein [Neurospora tetraspora]|uniref:Chaperonin 10-like protein n=1 Tax=Neurospora tetraspora TaxID=94610 RepID=A0AAE0JJ18_9PEZI|nr:chaperonin 10-like protein [Neurospora tetraspora]